MAPYLGQNKATEDKKIWLKCGVGGIRTHAPRKSVLMEDEFDTEAQYATYWAMSMAGEDSCSGDVYLHMFYYCYGG